MRFGKVVEAVLVRGASALTDPCGRFLPALLCHDLKDRLHGHRARANARWGWLTRPSSTGKLIWVVTGGTFHSVRLGVELARAIVARRLDISVTLTFESLYPELIAPLERSPRIGWGYGPADYVGSMNAVWRRLLPFAVILAGVAPRRNMLRVCENARHALLVAPPVSVVGRFERIYPQHVAPSPGTNCAPASDLDTLLTQADVAPDLAPLVKGDSDDRQLWWWHGADPFEAKRYFALFRGHLPNDVLFISGPAVEGLRAEVHSTLSISAWDRTPIPPTTLVLVDQPEWIPALAASASGAHFTRPATDWLWQALAGGASVSTTGDVDVASPNALSATGLANDENEAIQSWTRLRADPIAHRIAADASRRAFWSERRGAQNVVSELLDRVLAWN